MSIADRPGLAIGFVGGALANGGYTFANIMHMILPKPFPLDLSEHYLQVLLVDISWFY